MVNVGNIYIYIPRIDPMGTLIPRPTGLIGVTKEGKLQLLLRCLSSVQIGGECSPRVSPGVFMGLKGGIFSSVSPHAGVHLREKIESENDD